MDSLQWNKTESTLKKIRSEIPEVTDRTVLVKVSHAGVCGTDLHILYNEHRAGELLTLGHEISGTVEKVGNSVTHVKVGSKVVVEPNAWCNSCKFCRRGKPNYCNQSKSETIGITRNGGFANYCLVPANYVVPIPESLPLDKAALVEPMACVIHGFELLNQVPDGSKILVMGAGIIGLLWMNMLHHRGFKDITVVEIADRRRDIAISSGLNIEVLQPSDLQEKFKKINVEEDGFEVVIDCTGNPTAVEMAFDMLCCGGKLVIFGAAPYTAKMTIPPAPIVHKELTIQGVFISPYCFTKSINLINDMAEKYLNFEKLGIEKFSLDEFEVALDKLRKGKISKAMFCLNH